MSGMLEGRLFWTPTRVSGPHTLNSPHLYRRASPFVMSKEFFWACELNKSKKDYEWRLDSETDDEGCSIISHSLLLKQAILADSVPAGEEQVVEVETTGYHDVKLRCPIIKLKQETKPQRSVDLFLPTGMLKFHLVKGSGPVHLFGQHVVEYENDEEQGEEHLEEEEEENGETEDSPEKPQKRKASQPTKGNAKKMAKLDNSASDKTEEPSSLASPKAGHPSRVPVRKASKTSPSGIMSEPQEEGESSPEKKKKKPRGRGKSMSDEKVTPKKKK